jgi:hypothetical protein
MSEKGYKEKNSSEIFQIKSIWEDNDFLRAIFLGDHFLDLQV